MSLANFYASATTVTPAMPEEQSGPPARGRANYSRLSGAQKAAIMIMAVGEDHAARLFSLMDNDEISEISTSMASLGPVNARLVERLFYEFAEHISSPGSVVGSYESTERLLNKVLDNNRVAAIMEDIRGPAGRTMWDKLANVNEGLLANYLKNEYPQTVAVVLTKISPDHASRVLVQLPEALAMEVVSRILQMEAVQSDVVQDVERTLRTEFMNNLARVQRRDSHELVADIFNGLDRAAELRFVAGLEQHSPESAERIKALMFTFEDLARLEASSIQTLLRALDMNRLAVALKGAPEELSNLFLANMSERAAKILREDMEVLGPLRVRDIDEARQEILAKTMELAEKSEIIISEGGGEDQLVY